MTKRKLKIDEILKAAGLTETAKRLEEQGAEIERLKESERKSRLAATEALKAFLEDNRRFWTRGNGKILTSGDIHIDDPIHQHVLIEKEIAPIFLHPMVQRLSHIKQLSFSYLTFPTATHTRLSHCLGVCKNAELALASILQKGVLYTAEGKQTISLSAEQKSKLLVKAKVVALLHDLGHAPFGHGLDLYLSAELDEPSPDKFHATDYIDKYLRDVITECGLDVDEILRILDKNKRNELDGYDMLISNIVDSPLDVDRMDYLVRDAHMTGLSIGTVNIHALIQRMLPFEGAISTEGGVKKQTILVFEPSATPYITHLLYARDSMYLNCYEHQTKVVAEKMLIKGISAFRAQHPLPIDDLVLLTDEQLLGLILQYSDPKDVSYKYADALLRNLPFELLFSIHPKKREEWEQKKENAKREGKVVEREEEEIPQKPAARIEHWENDSLMYKTRNLTVPSEWEEAIAKAAGLREEDWWKVLVTVPSPGMFEPKFDEIEILVRKEGDKYTYRRLDEMTGFWEGVLRHLAVERYSIKVFGAVDLSERQVEAVKKAAEGLLTDKL